MLISSALIAALIMVESGGNDLAIGDNGKALGVLQIHACVVEDVNRIYCISFQHKDAYIRRRAIRMCEFYLHHYGRLYERRTGLPANDEVLARIWNGGPRGYEKQATTKYWEKVQRALKQH